MKSGIQLYTIIGIFLFACYDVSLGQSTNDTYRHISSRDGLSSGFVWDMMEDRNGFIWIATNNGLDKYDGYSVTNYRSDPSDINSITPGEVYNIMEDQAGMIWVGTSGGLSILNPSTGRFHQIRVSSSTQSLRGVRSLVQGENGTVWAGTANGVYCIPVQDFLSDTLNVELLDTDALGEPLNGITVLAIDNSIRILWIGTDSKFHKFDLDAKEFTQLEQFDEEVNQVLTNPIWNLLVDSNGTLWISSTTGLVAWHKDNDKPKAITELGPYDNEDLSDVLFQSLTEDKDGGLWIGTGFIGAMRLDLETGDVQTYRHEDSNLNSIREDDIHYVFVDSEENTWFGYHNFGMSLMYSQTWNYDLKFASGAHDPGDPINIIRNMKEDEAGNLWLATEQGLVIHPADSSPVKNFIPFPDNLSNVGLENHLSTLQVFDNQVITGTVNGSHLFIFDIQNETFDIIAIPDSLEALIYGEITYTEEYIYLGSLTRRLILLSRSTYEISTIDVPGREPDDFAQKPVLTFLDREGNILIQSIHIYQTDNKLEWDSYLFDPSDESFTKPDIQSPEDILARPFPSRASKHQPGTVWSLLNTGVFREDYLNAETEIYFQNEANVLNETPQFLYEDNDGYLWLAGPTGITKLDPDTETLSYYEADPARLPTPIPFFSIANQLSNGDLVFPGRGGYIQFNPNELTSDMTIQKVHITELWAGSDIYHTLSGSSQPYELEYSNNNISVAYLGLNYRDPNFTRYRYRLHGYDNEWNSVETQRRIFLANLPPGEYTFQVQAATRYGWYSENTDEINITILPPWWRTITAYIMYALLFIGGVITIDRVQRKRVISKERERSREKELAQAKEIEKAYKHLKAAQEQLVQQEKLASLGQLTAGIAHEIKNPLNFVTNFSEVSLEMIEEAREEIRDLRQGMEENPLSRGESEGGAGARGVSDEAENEVLPRKSEIVSSSVNTPLNPLSRGEAGPSPQIDLILEILDDIEANLRKIHEHGSRADGIVKSMLQHSRGGSGKIQPTDLNALVKEYVNLAYHGMRAGKDPISVDIDLHLDYNIGEVPLIAEDFSRVILNLCNNAFDAMREKQVSGYKEQGSGEYNPKLTGRTHQTEKAVTIEIEDNGPGIPDEIKDNILQPFFTTKKGTQGTGLGLSITHDIVKAHGGQIEIDSDNSGTVFRIVMPS